MANCHRLSRIDKVSEIRVFCANGDYQNGMNDKILTGGIFRGFLCNFLDFYRKTPLSTNNAYNERINDNDFLTGSMSPQVMLSSLVNDLIFLPTNSCQIIPSLFLLCRISTWD